MPIAYPQILDQTSEGEARWDATDSILYALGVGMGADPMDENELAFVYEARL
jgi:hypothetical protein